MKIYRKGKESIDMHVEDILKFQDNPALSGTLTVFLGGLAVVGKLPTIQIAIAEYFGYDQAVLKRDFLIAINSLPYWKASLLWHLYYDLLENQASYWNWHKQKERGD